MISTSSRAGLRSANALILVVYVLLIVMVLGEATGGEVFDLREFDESSDDGEVYRNYTNEFRFDAVIVVFLLLGAVRHALVAGPLWRWYRSGIEAGRNRFRWVDYGFGVPVLLVLLVGATNSTDETAIILLCGLGICMVRFASLAEAARDVGPKWQAFRSALFTAALVVIGYDLAADRWMDDLPAFLQRIGVWLVLLGGGFVVNLALHLRARGAWRNPVVGEACFLAIDLLLRFVLVMELADGVLGPSSTYAP